MNENNCVVLFVRRHAADRVTPFIIEVVGRSEHPSLVAEAKAK